MPTKQCRIPIVLALLGLLGSITTGEDWPQFRGPGGQGHSLARDLPLTWDVDTNVVWKTPLPGSGWSSPVVSSGRIYATAAVPTEDENGGNVGESTRKVESRYSLRTVCLRFDTGKMLWNKETSEVPADTSIHRKNSHASATPVIRSDRVYVHFGTYGTAALDLDGNIIWQKRIEYKPVHGSGSSLVLFGDLLIFNCDGGESPFVIALDAATGKERWRTPRPKYDARTFSFSTPLVIEVDGKPQLVSAGSHAACGYDPKTGKQLWVVRYPDKWSIVPRPVFADGLVLICTGYEGPAELLAIRPNGEGEVTDTHVVWRAKKFVPHNPSPIIHDNSVYLISDDGIASCRELKTGKLHWKKRLGGAFAASPVLAEKRIYFLSEEGVCTVVKATPEFEQLARNDLNERTFASIAPVNKSLLIRTESRLYRIGK